MLLVKAISECGERERETERERDRETEREGERDSYSRISRTAEQ